MLRRDEPVEITLVNQLAEATAIHWHGIELDSYYDGVHGWSGIDRRVTPMIEPGGTFVVRFTPPRAGTFIYHTHLHDYRQLSSGLYGPLIVTNAGETFDPATDHVIVLGRSGLTSDEPSVLTDPESVVMNGERAPRFVWKAGAASSRAADQHHARRHLQRRTADVRGAGDVDARRQGWRAAAGRRVRRRSRRARRLPSAKPTSSTTRRLQAARPRGSKYAPPAASGRCRAT